jgi:Zn-dependent peptidase ImmA (M78 family)
LKFLKYSEIEELAERFLKEHHPERTLPVPIDDIVELSLQIQIVPHKDLARLEQIDAFLSSDFTELHIDQDHYIGRTNRSRFTLAHEVGHFVMHKEQVAKVNSANEWKRIILQAGEGRDLYESQANDFAGCLLMPRDLMQAEFDKCKEQAAKEFQARKMALPDDLTIYSWLAGRIAPIFDVSDKAAEIRLGKILRKLQ